MQHPFPPAEPVIRYRFRQGEMDAAFFLRLSLKPDN